jgi:hypothetical protein
MYRSRKGQMLIVASTMVPLLSGSRLGVRSSFTASKIAGGQPVLLQPVAEAQDWSSRRARRRPRARRGRTAAWPQGRPVHTFLSVQVTSDIDVTAHQLAASVTYAVTPRFDVNLTVPLLHTSLDLTANGLAPDPRFPQFALQNGRTITVRPLGSADATGVGDVLLST